LRAVCRLRGQAECIVELAPLRRALTFNEFCAHARALARTLPRRSNIAVVCGNSVDAIVLFLACLMADCTVMPVSAAAPDLDVLDTLGASGPVDLLFYAPARRALANAVQCPTRELVLPPSRASEVDNNDAEEEPTDLNRPWAILHTSGTTRTKRGVIRSQLATILGALVHQQTLCLGAEDVYFATWPVHGISTFFFSFASLYLGAKVVLASPDASVDALASSMAAERASFITGPPSLLCALGKQRLSASLRRVLVSGTTLSPASRRELLNAYSPSSQQPAAACQVYQAYGSTEAGVVTLQRVADANEGVGWPPPGCAEVRIDAATREVLVSTRSPMFMLGYVHGVALPKWFGMGDEGELVGSAVGLVITGRVDDRIGLPSGHDFMPQEVEQALTDGVVGLGEPFVFLNRDNEVGLLVVGGQVPAERAVDEIQAVLAARVAPHKRPRAALFVPSVDADALTSTNKVKRRALAGFAASHRAQVRRLDKFS